MVLIVTQCPFCGEEMVVGIDDSCGPPTEAGDECECCGALPVFAVIMEPFYTLGAVLRDESIKDIGRGVEEAKVRAIAEQAEVWAAAEDADQAEAASLVMKRAYGPAGPEYKLYVQLCYLRQLAVWTTVEQAIALVQEGQ